MFAAKMSVFSRPWFWVVLVGVVLAAVGVVLLVITSENQTLWIVLLVLGILLAIGGGIYGAIRRTPERALVLQEEDLATRKEFGRKFGEGIENFNQGVAKPIDDYTENRFEQRFGDFSRSAGSLAAAPVGSGLNVLYHW